MDGDGADRRALPPGFPAFSIAWLVVTSLLYLALAGPDGRTPAAVQETVGFTPAEAARAPHRAVLAVVGVLIVGDAVQYAYLVALFALFTPAFEAREGGRRTVLVFAAGGAAAVAAGTLLVLLPLALTLPDHPLVTHAVSRPYLGWSSAAFAIAGALAGTLSRPAARWGLLAALTAWETGIWILYFRFTELVSVFHYFALAIGFAAGRLGVGAAAPSARRRRP